MSAGSEILVQISDHRLKVAEVPIRVRYDLEGTSSENPVAHGFGVLQNLAKLIIVRRPLPLFGIPGFLFAGIGIGALAYYSYNYSHIGEFYNLAATGTSYMLIMGLALMAAGIFLSYRPTIVNNNPSGASRSSNNCQISKRPATSKSIFNRQDETKRKSRMYPFSRRYK